MLYNAELVAIQFLVAVGFHFPECYTKLFFAFTSPQLRLAFIFQSAIPMRFCPYWYCCCGWLSFSRVLYCHPQYSWQTGVAVGFHFPECYTRGAECPLRLLLRLAFIFQSAIPSITAPPSVRRCGWLSFSRVLYLVDGTHRRLVVAVGFHFPECYTATARKAVRKRLRLAFIFQSAILSASKHWHRRCCGWLSFSRVLYVLKATRNNLLVAVGFHFPECYTGKAQIKFGRQLRLAFIFQSAIPTSIKIGRLQSCGWLSFSRVLYQHIQRGYQSPVAVGFHFPECYTSPQPSNNPDMLRLAFIFQSAIQLAHNTRSSPSCGWLSFSRVLYSMIRNALGQQVAVGFHFPECYTFRGRLPPLFQLRLAFIFQSAILATPRTHSNKSCGWLSFSRVLYKPKKGVSPA